VSPPCSFSPAYQRSRASGSASPREDHPWSERRPSSSQRSASLSLEPTGSKIGWGRREGRARRLPEWAKSQSRRPQARANGWVLASVAPPQVAVRTCTTKSEDSRCSQAFTSSERIDPFGGAGSFSTVADGSPPG